MEGLSHLLDLGAHGPLLCSVSQFKTFHELEVGEVEDFTKYNKGVEVEEAQRETTTVFKVEAKGVAVYLSCQDLLQ